MNRRSFLEKSLLTGAATTACNLFASPAPRVKWAVGCFNRPWTKWGFDAALDGVKAAGYKTTGLLSRTREEPFISANSTPEYLEGLKKRIAARGLKANMGALNSRHNIPLADSIKEVRKQIDNARFLKLEYVLSFGTDRPTEFEHYFKVMSDAAAHAAERDIKLVMKPHGGASGSSDEILRCIKAVNHRNFKIWYDAGNIIHYTGKDPVTELEPIVEHVTGFCAKDCASERGEVMIQFGTGKVDFAGVFKKLKAAGFNGPVMVECCQLGPTAEEVTANAKANREFLEKVLASV